MKTRLLFFLVCVLNVIGAYAAIQSTFEVNGIKYYITDETAMTVSVDKPGSNYEYYTGLVNIPASITYNGNTYSVTGIEHDAFRGQGKLTSVVFPKTLKTIGYKAFLGCSALKTVAFSSTGVLTTIDYEAFSACKQLTSINLPASVKTIGHHAFEDCEALKTLNLSNIEILDKAAFKGCSNLVDVKIPDSVKSIGEMCFWGCSKLRNLTLGSSLEYIGPDAFLENHMLEDFVIPSSVKEIGYEAFRSCFMLEHMVIPNSVTKIGYGVFRYCVSLKSIKWSESSDMIPNLAFEQSDLESITIPASVKTIGTSAFSECLKLKEIKFGNGDGKPMNLTNIYDNAFIGCTALTSVILPEPLTKIYEAAFAKCENLEFVSIPRTVSSIGKAAFQKCYKLDNVNNLASVPQNTYNTIPFYDSSSQGFVNVHVYEGLYDLYTTTLGWYDIPASNYYCWVKIIADIPVVAVESIQFLENPIYCFTGELKSPTIKLMPQGAAGTDLVWTSSDESVLFVDMYSGEMIGLEKGESTPSVSVSDKPSIKASVKVIVTDEAGLDDVNVDTPAETVIYDIYGRRHNTLQKGINIVNGKKIFVK